MQDCGFPRNSFGTRRRTSKYGGSGSKTLDLHDHELLVWFDLRWPIEPQLRNAKRILAERAKGRIGQFRFRYRPKIYAIICVY